MAANGDEGYEHISRSAVAPDSVTAAPPESSQCGMCHRVRHALRRWWKVALFVGVLLGAVAAACVWWNYVPVYTAEAKLQLKEQRPYIAFDQRDSPGVFVSTQLQLFKTRAILSPALETIARNVPKVNEMDDPIAWLEKNIDAQVIAGSELVSVQFSDPDPETAEKVLDAVVNSYLQYHRKYDRNLTLAVVGVLQDEKDRREKVLTELRNRVRDLSRKTGTGDADTASFVAQLTEQLRDTELDEKVATAELQAMQESAGASIEELRQQLTSDLGEVAAAEAARPVCGYTARAEGKTAIAHARRQVLRSALDEAKSKATEQWGLSG